MPSHQGEHVRPMTVAGLMRQAARYNAHQIAVMHGDRELSFIDAYERGIRMANGLLALGLNPGIVSRFWKTTVLSPKTCFWVPRSPV